MSSLSSGKVLKLKSEDNQIFEVKESVAMQSELIKTMVKDGCAIGVIPLLMVHSKTLTKILEWCQNHVGCLEENKAGDEDEEELKKWESKFVDVDTDSLYELFIAANYLNIKNLVNRVAKQIVEEIRETFGIKNDFIPEEEEEEIRKQNSWN